MRKILHSFHHFEKFEVCSSVTLRYLLRFLLFLVFLFLRFSFAPLELSASVDDDTTTVPALLSVLFMLSFKLRQIILYPAHHWPYSIPISSHVCLLVVRCIAHSQVEKSHCYFLTIINHLDFFLLLLFSPFFSAGFPCLDLLGPGLGLSLSSSLES